MSWLAPEDEGEFSLDVLGATEAEAQARAQAAYEALVAATPWALTIGADDGALDVIRDRAGEL